MKHKPQFASRRVVVPAGFSGWWCERCEKPAENIPDEAGSPAHCGRCKKWTAVWVPPSAEVESLELRAESGEKPRVPRAERAAAGFAAMRAAADGKTVAEMEAEKLREYIE